jgi:hypothetical protein
MNSLSNFQQLLVWVYAVSVVLSAIYATCHYDVAAKQIADETRRRNGKSPVWAGWPSAIFVIVCPVINTFIAGSVVLIVIGWTLVHLTRPKR